MSTPPDRYTNDEDDAQHWLMVLRDGTSTQRIEARSRLARIFEKRGMIEEATDLLVSNVRAGARNADIFRWLARLYKAQGQDLLSVQAAAEAAKYLSTSTSVVARDLAPSTFAEVRPAIAPARCARCGTPVQTGVKLCPECAAAQSRFPVQQEPRTIREVLPTDGPVDPRSKICRRCGKQIPVTAPRCSCKDERRNARDGRRDARVEARNDQPYVVAGSGRRFLNLLIDNIAIYAFAFIAAIVIALAAPDLIPTFQTWPKTWGIALYIAYFVLFEATIQRTPAKLITRTKVVDEAGDKPGLGAIVGRTLSRLVPFEAFSGLWSSPPSWWHDRWSGTRVIRG